MPVTLQFGDVVSVRLEYSDESALGDVAFNVLHYKALSINDNSTGLPVAVPIPIAPVMSGLAQIAYDAFALDWKAFASEDVVMIGCTAQKVYTSPRSTPFHYTPVAPVSGIILGDALPMQDAVTILKQTGYGQRWGMGRVFVPGIPELHTEGGRITPDAVTNLANLIDQFEAYLVVDDGTNTTTFRPVLYQAARLSDDPPVPLRITDVTECVLSDTIVKTQRRRRPGKGS